MATDVPTDAPGVCSSGWRDGTLLRGCFLRARREQGRGRWDGPAHLSRRKIRGCQAPACTAARGKNLLGGATSWTAADLGLRGRTRPGSASRAPRVENWPKLCASKRLRNKYPALAPGAPAAPTHRLGRAAGGQRWFGRIRTNTGRRRGLRRTSDGSTHWKGRPRPCTARAAPREWPSSPQARAIANTYQLPGRMHPGGAPAGTPGCRASPVAVTSAC